MKTVKVNGYVECYKTRLLRSNYYHKWCEEGMGPVFKVSEIKGNVAILEVECDPHNDMETPEWCRVHVDSIRYVGN